MAWEGEERRLQLCVMLFFWKKKSKMIMLMSLSSGVKYLQILLFLECKLPRTVYNHCVGMSSYDSINYAPSCSPGMFIYL